MSESAIRPLRTAIIDALKDGVSSVSNRVFTPPIKQTETRFPRLVIDGYTEEQSNLSMYGTPGSRVRALVKGQAKSDAGDTPRESLWQEVYATLHDQPIEVEGHMVLEGTLHRTASYLDPDGHTLHFVGVYTGTTRMA